MTGQGLRITVELDVSPSTTPAGPGATLPTRRRIACRCDMPGRRVYMDGPHEISDATQQGRAYEVRGLDTSRMHLLFVALDNDADVSGGLDGSKRYQVLTEPPEVEYDIDQATKTFHITVKPEARIDYSTLNEGMFSLPDDLGLTHINALTISSSRPGNTEGSIIVRVVTPGTTVAEPFVFYAELQEKPGDKVLEWEWLAP